LDANEHIKVITLNINQIRNQAETVQESLLGTGVTAFLISFFPTAISRHGNIRNPGFIYCPGLVSPQTSTQDTITVALTAMQSTCGPFNICPSGSAWLLLAYIMKLPSSSLEQPIDGPNSFQLFPRLVKMQPGKLRHVNLTLNRKKKKDTRLM
jgi:hypothetical protein